MALLQFQRWVQQKKGKLYTQMIKYDFGAIGKGSIIYAPFHSNNASEVYMGKNCLVFGGSWFDTIKEYASIKYQPRIDIGDNVYFGFRVHLSACLEMKIGNDVVIADDVFISDNSHGYKDINKPVLYSPLITPGPINIEDQAWIGKAVCVLPNVTIGKHSIVSSNAVVTKDIPPYCIAAGAPAKVIKKYNHVTNQWEKVIL